MKGDMQEDLEVLKGYIESLGLLTKSEITIDDLKLLRDTLNESDEYGLADYVSNLTSPNELIEMITQLTRLQLSGQSSGFINHRSRVQSAPGGPFLKEFI